MSRFSKFLIPSLLCAMLFAVGCGDDDKKQEACDLIVETYEALLQERGEGDRIWGSMIKQTLKRQKPGFSESTYGFRSFGELLEEAKTRGLVTLQRDEKSGDFLVTAGK